MNLKMTIDVDVELQPEPYLENLADEFAWDDAFRGWVAKLRSNAAEVLLDDPGVGGKLGMQVTAQPTAKTAQLAAFVLQSPFGEVVTVVDLQERVEEINGLVLEQTPDLLLRAAEG